MVVLLPIGDFSRMTYLSVKALRHYHEIGLLDPADVDATSGYRLYQPQQIPTAQVIRRLRDLGMPLENIRTVLDAPDVQARTTAMADHLRRLEQHLEQTQAAVASLRRLLEAQPSPIEVEYRSESAIQTIAVHGKISMGDTAQWWADAFSELHDALAASGASRAGPDGALYSPEFFQADAGDVVAFIPITGDKMRPTGSIQPFEILAVELAVTVHCGAFSELDRTYGALGTFVAERAIGVDGPIRENYLVTPEHTDDEELHRTEVCWPVFRTTEVRDQDTRGG
jgi:DNA-binding transcriptional MerR regulator